MTNKKKDKAQIKLEEATTVLISSYNTLEKGATATKIYSGFFDVDYKTSFRDGLAWVETADRMKLSDEQVFALLNDVKKPIRTTKWFIKPATDEQIDVEIKEYIEAAVFEQINFREYINNALTMLEYGFSVFEIVHKIINHEKYGTMLALKKMAFREPYSILKWNFNKETKEFESIEQQGQGDLSKNAIIPATFLQVNTINKQGENLTGLSPLRACYRYFLVKDESITTQRRGIAFASSGVPIILTSENDSVILQKMQSSLNKFLSGQSQGLILPSGTNGLSKTEVKELKITHDAAAVQAWIDFLDVKIARAFNAGFAELGLNGKSGSLALGESKTQNFLQGVKELPELICENFNKIIKTLVEWKYGKQPYYPELAFGELDTTGLQARAESLVKLADAELIQKSPSVKEAIHNEFKLPYFDRQLEEEQKQIAANANINKLHENCEHKEDFNKVFYFTEDKLNALQNPKIQLNEIEKVRLNEIVKNKSIKLSEIKALHLSGKYDKSTVLSSWLQDLSGFYSFAQKKPEAVKIIENGEVKILSLIQKTLETRGEKYINSIMKRYNENAPLSEIYNLSIPDKKAFTDELTLELAKLSMIAKDGALKETGFNGVKLDELSDAMAALPKITKDKVKYQAQTIIDSLDEGFKTALFTTLNADFNRLEAAPLKAQLVQQAKQYIDSPRIITGATNFASDAVNSARNDVFQTKEVFDGIESFIFFNPDPISNICQNLNGTVFSKEEYKNTRFLPPLHHRCKSIIIPQMTTGKNNKPFNRGGYLIPTGTEKQIEDALKTKRF